MDTISTEEVRQEGSGDKGKKGGKRVKKEGYHTIEGLSCDVRKILRSEKVDDRNRVDLMVVKWSSAKVPVLEKRRIWIMRDGEIRYRKMSGLSLDDVKFVKDNFSDIVTYF